MSAFDMNEKIAIRQLKLAFESLPPALLAGLGIAALLSLLQMDVVDSLYVWSWFFALFLISAVRFFLAVAYHKQDTSSYQVTKRYEPLFYMGVIASGLIWGSAGLLLFPEQSVEHQFFLAFALAGISTGAVISLSSNSKHFITFMLLVLLPISLHLIYDMHGIPLTEGLMFLLLISLLFVLSKKVNNIIASMLRMQEQSLFEAEKSAQQKNLFELILENIPARIFWKDRELRYLGANKHFLAEAKLPEGISIVGLSDSEMPWADRYADFIEKERSIVSHKTDRLHYEEHSFTLDGQERWLEIIKTPILNEAHEIEGLLGILEDITQRKQAETMLHLAATAFETHEAITITDATGNIISVNKAFSEITGYEFDEVVGRKSSILSAGKHDIHFYQNMWADLIKDGRWKGEIINRRKNGSEFTEQLTITAVKDDEGNILSYVGVFSDVSEKKELEKQLQQLQKLDTVGTLVSGVAHEFNNMLVGISGNVFLSMDKVEHNSEVYEMLAIADDICFKAADLVKQLLTFARKEDAIQHLKPINMAEWLTDGLKLAQSSIPANYNIVYHAADEKLMISADTTQLQQIIINLLNNARDASEFREQPVIEIELGSGFANQEFREQNHFKAVQFVKLTVRDNGSGIPADKMEKIFEPFFTTKAVGKGTGLGMPVIQNLVHAHGGCIQVESVVDEGTAFHIYLPKLQLKHLQNADDVAVEPVAIGHGETILIADDEPGVLLVTSRLLKSLGYRTVEASCGAEAIELFSKEPMSFDLVFLDVVMPGFSGPSAAHKIREIRPEIPLAFYTGYSEDELLADIRTFENAKIIGKPYRLAEVSELLHSMLNP